MNALQTAPLLCLKLPLHWVAWNLLSRIIVLLILGLFSWHLKATLLTQQNQKE